MQNRTCQHCKQEVSWHVAVDKRHSSIPGVGALVAASMGRGTCFPLISDKLSPNCQQGFPTVQTLTGWGMEARR